MVGWAALEAALGERLQGGRLAHVYRVRETALALSGLHGADPEQAAVAGLICTRVPA